jgi:hypothetical protein
LCCWAALAGVAGLLRVGGCWFRPIRCAWRSFLVVVLMADGWWFRPIRCAWGSFLVLVVALAGVPGLLRMVVVGSGPLGAHRAPSLSLC